MIILIILAVWVLIGFIFAPFAGRFLAKGKGKYL
jgi:hypothetical protein